MRNLIKLSFVAAFLLGACNLPSARTPQPDEVATRVAEMLTIQPSEVTLPTQSAQITGAPSVTVTSPTQLPSLTPTLSAEDPRKILGTSTWTDHFDGNPQFGVISDEHVRVEQGSNALHLTALQADGWHSWTMASPELSDFYLEATVTTGVCSGRDRYGIFFRAPDPNQGYFLAFTCDGNYAIRKWDGTSFTDLLQSSSPSGSINAGSNQTNRIGIRAADQIFTIFANGTKIGEVTDSSYKSGGFGLMIASYVTPNFTVNISEVSYWKMQ
ncbi:MAG: hypothetical protein ABFD44_12645 [Anaerolineaceae bacterium]